jgi:ABC-2 type transport system permease protein
MNIFVHEFKTKIRSVLIWAASVCTLLVVFMSISPSFRENAAALSEVMSNFPPQLLIAFGMNDLDFASALGYFGLMFLFCQICLAIQAANYGFGLVSIEENEFTADFLLAKPVSRRQIMNSKLLAAIISLIVTAAILSAATVICLRVFMAGESYAVEPLVLLMFSVLPFQLVFLSVGMFISLLVKQVRNVTPYSMGLVFGLYILKVFGEMLGKKSVEVISPFLQFNPSAILKNNAFDPLAFISVAAIVISIAGSYLLYRRRNIRSAV